MFPFLEFFFGIQIYTFGVSLTLCFFLFLWNLERLSHRLGYSFSFFSQNIVWFFLSTFFFSRLFYVVGRWHDMRFIKDPFQFFVMSEFNFSLFGAIFGFTLVLYYALKREKSSLLRYLDGLVLSFLLIMIVGFIGALLGGQVYGRETMLGIELRYTHAYTPVPFQVPIFPLPIIYALGSFIIFSALYILSLFIHIRGYIGYIGLLAFSTMIIVFEFFSGKEDILSVVSIFNLPQVYALVMFIWSGVGLFRIFDTSDENKEVHLEV